MVEIYLTMNIYAAVNSCLAHLGVGMTGDNGSKVRFYLIKLH